jgi:hypothetical protein
MHKGLLLIIGLCLPVFALAEDTSNSESKRAKSHVLTVNLAISLTCTFQVPLGGGEGPDLTAVWSAGRSFKCHY